MTDEEILSMKERHADRIETMGREWGVTLDQLEAAEARIEALTTALRAIQTYLAEPAPEVKVNDLKGDLRWVSQRVNAALQGVKT